MDTTNTMMLTAPLAVWAFFGGALVCLFTVIYWRYSRLGLFAAFRLALLGDAIGMAWVVLTKGRILDPSPFFQGGNARRQDDEIPFLAFMLALLTGIGIVVKLYRVWVMDAATPGEREPNGTGLRAWLGVGNVLLAMLFMAAAYEARHWDPLATLAGVVGLFLAYPLVNCLTRQGNAPADGEGEELAEERRRVLAMVEAGKVSGEDGAELIAALGQSRVLAREAGANRVQLTRNVRVVMLGAALVVVGFCLPWFSVDLGAPMQEAMGNMQQAMPAGLSLPPGYPVQVAQRTVLEVRGGDVEHGLGWMILAMAGAVAVMPLVWARRGEQRDAQRAATIVGLLVGSVLMMYLVSFFYRDINVGMVLAMAGYAVMWVGVVREYVRPRVGMAAVAG